MSIGTVMTSPGPPTRLATPPKAQGREASMYGYAYIQWKVAMARTQNANLAAAEINEQCQPTPA
jgi:hypothetical protein